jgi:hypothetical protein
MRGADATRPTATVLFFLYIMAVFAWRQLSKAPRIQNAIHGAYMGAGLQWYTLLLIGCAVMVVLTVFEFFWSYYRLDDGQVLNNLKQSYAVASLPNNATFADFKAHLSIPLPLERLSMLSIWAGIPVLMVAAGHIFMKLAYPGMRILQAKGGPEASRTPWCPAPRMNRLITLLIMPIVLSVMSMRGSCRIWALTTGQAYNSLQKSYDQVETWEIALYHMDKEVGMTFQFFSVYAFIRVCGSFLTEALRKVGGSNNPRNSGELADVAGEFRQLIRYGGFLAVWAFICVGVLRCLLEFFVESWRYFEIAQGNGGVFSEPSVSKVEQAIVQPADTIFSFLTILCVANMFIVGRTKIIKERLGNANMKFMGARLLLLIIAVQEQALLALIPATEMNRSFRRALAKAADYADHGLDVEAIQLTELQADLLHMSLLNFECLFVVIFNAIVWRDLDLQATGVALYGFQEETRRRRLLSSLCVAWAEESSDEEAPRSPACGAAEDSSSSSSSSSPRLRGDQRAILLDQQYR